MLLVLHRAHAPARIASSRTRRARLHGGTAMTLAGLRLQKVLAVEMKNALLRRRLDEFGRPARTTPGRRRSRCPRAITTDFIDEAYAAAPPRGRARRQGHRRRRRRLHALLLRVPAQAPGRRGADHAWAARSTSSSSSTRTDHVEPARWLTPTSIRDSFAASMHAEMALAGDDRADRAGSRRSRRARSRRAARRRQADPVRQRRQRGRRRSTSPPSWPAASSSSARRCRRCRWPTTAPRFTAIGNDYAYEDVFARQLRAFGGRRRRRDRALHQRRLAQRARRAGAGARARAGRRSAITGAAGHRPAGWPTLPAHALRPRRRGSRRARCSSRTRSASWSSTSCSREAARRSSIATARST